MEHFIDRSAGATYFKAVIHIFVMLILCISSGTRADIGVPINQVRNSSFEYGTASWGDDKSGFGWQRERVNGRMSVSDRFGHMDQFSILLEFNDSPGGHRYVTTAQRIAVKPHSRYRIGVKSFSEGLVRNGASIIVNPGWDQRPIVFAGGTDRAWQDNSNEFMTGAANFIYLRLLIENRGRIWLDDISLSEVVEAERIPKAVRYTDNRTGRYYDLPIHYERMQDAQVDVQRQINDENRRYQGLYKAGVLQYVRPPSMRQNCVGFVTQQLWERVPAHERHYQTEFLSKGADRFYRNVLIDFAERVNLWWESPMPGDIVAFVQTVGDKSTHVAIVNQWDERQVILSKDQWDSVVAIVYSDLINRKMFAKYFNDNSFRLEFFRLDPRAVTWKYLY